MEEVKVCIECLVELPITDFYVKDKSGARVARCMTCVRARLRERYANDRPYRERKLYANRPLYRQAWLKRKYGLSLEEYDDLFRSQGTKCALCRATHHGRTGHGLRAGQNGVKREWKPKHWPIDHDPKTGRVRGILCHACNTRLGSFELLMASIGYDRLSAYLSDPKGDLRDDPASAAPVPKIVRATS